MADQAGKADAIPGERQPGVPAELQPVASSLTLPQLLAVAFDNTPATRQASEQARSAAAAWGAARGEYYPAATIGAQGLVARGSAAATTGTAVVVGGGSPNRTVAGLANLTLTYLLLDFGGRRGRADSAEQALVGANWNHSQVIQDVARNVARAYHSYVGAKSQVVASRATLEEAQTSLEAVEVRRLSGVATVADLYQAQSNVAQARLGLERDEGNVDTARGVLATSVGWPANTPFDVAAMDDVPMEVFDRSVDDLIEEAQHRRPDLAAVRAFLRRKEADLRQAESARWPTLSSVMSVGTIKRTGPFRPAMIRTTSRACRSRSPSSRAARSTTPSAARVRMSRRRARRCSSRATWWCPTCGIPTSTCGRRRSRSSPARPSCAAPSSRMRPRWARYRAGATNIVELVTVQSTLAGARSQQVQARTNLYTSYAELLPGRRHGATRRDARRRSGTGGVHRRTGPGE